MGQHVAIEVHQENIGILPDELTLFVADLGNPGLLVGQQQLFSLFAHLDNFLPRGIVFSNGGKRR